MLERDSIRRYLETRLSAWELTVLSELYGLTGTDLPPQTYDEVAHRHGKARQSVDNARRAAFRKLQNDSVLGQALQDIVPRARVTGHIHPGQPNESESHTDSGSHHEPWWLHPTSSRVH